MDYIGSGCIEPMTPGSRLVEEFGTLEPTSSSLKTTELVLDDWPKPLNENYPYVGTEAGGTPTRVNLSSVPPLSVPFSPGALWISGGLGFFSPMHVFSPIMPPYRSWFSPTVPTSASLSESNRVGNEPKGIISPVFLPNEARNPLNSEIDAEFNTTSHHELSRTTTQPKQMAGEFEQRSVVKLSMPPKCIERRNIGYLEHGLCGTDDPCNADYNHRQDDAFNQKAGTNTAIEKKTSGKVSKSFKFRLPRGRSPRGKPVRSSAARHGRQTKYVAENETKPARSNYEHIWANQREALTDLLNEIGFEVGVIKHALYSCSLCTETFSSRMFVVRHALRDHIHGKPFECEKCHLRFSRADTLVRHMKRKHDLN